MTRVNQLCHQIAAARSIIREQMERAANLEREVGNIMGVPESGGYQSGVFEDFFVEVTRSRHHAAQVHITEMKG